MLYKYYLSCTEHVIFIQLPICNKYKTQNMFDKTARKCGKKITSKLDKLWR